MAYLDYPSVNCAVLPQDAQCNCADENTAFKVPPFCLSGDEQHSLLKCGLSVADTVQCCCHALTSWSSSYTQQSLVKATAAYQTMLHNTEYRAFLDYMCPGAAARGLFPPPGSNPSVCPSLDHALTSDDLCLLSATAAAAGAAAHCTHTIRAVIGTYDDHDSGWNNGDSRTPRKAAFKEMFLDAIGEPRDSPRHARHFCTSCK
eukprot:20578-Heterococcus_DN1.PRE.2